MNMRSIPRYTLVWGAHYLSKNMAYSPWKWFCAPRYKTTYHRNTKIIL